MEGFAANDLPTKNAVMIPFCTDQPMEQLDGAAAISCTLHDMTDAAALSLNFAVSGFYKARPENRAASEQQGHLLWLHRSDVPGRDTASVKTPPK